MVDQIDDNANVQYNGKLLLDGSHNKAVVHPGTYTSLTNESFSEDTTETTPLTELKDFNGTSLGIHDTDTITVSYVKQGKTHVLPFSAKDLTFEDIFATPPADADIRIFSIDSLVGTDTSGNPVYTPDARNAITFVAQQPGVEGQISGLTISVTDSNGKINKNANAILDNFTETVRAENESPDNSIVLQIGTKANQAVKIGLTDMRSTALGLTATDGSKLNISTQKNANAAINVLETALQKALDQQTEIGSVQMRLGFTSANIITSSENTQASESVIRDTDMAAEMSEYTKNNVLEQASQSMLAQANQNSSSVLSLLQ